MASMEFWTRGFVDQGGGGKDIGKWSRRSGGGRELLGMGGVGKKWVECMTAIGFLFGHLLNTKTMAEQNSTMGDQELLNALFEMLRNRQAKDNSTMLHEGISKGIPTPSMPLSTSGIMSEDVSRNTPSMQFIGTEDHFMPSTSRSKDHNIPSTSIRDVSRIPTELNLPTPDRTTHQFRNNPSNMGSVRVLPPTPEQVSWRSLIESQSQILGLLPDTLENAEAREKISKQIQLWETALVESAGLPSDQPENNDTVANVPIGASISTSKTATVSSVTTRGMQEVTILLTSEGNVLKDEKGIKFFHFIFRRAEQLFGNTIQVDWRKQANNKKNELFADVIKSFGNPGFNKEVILDIARKYIHSKRDNLRSKLTKDLRYPRPAWITDQLVWDELMKDAKFKRKVHNNPNYRPSARSGGKRRLRDTTKATQARVSSIGSHKLGSGGYNSICGGMVHQFEKEASEEDLKYALLHGSQGLRQRMLDRGEKLITGHEFEEAQQTNSSGEVSSSEHEEELEAPVELCVAHNESILICGPQQETIPEIQQMADKNNEEGLQCDDQSLSRIRIVPRRKRTQRKRMDSNIP